MQTKSVPQRRVPSSPRGQRTGAADGDSCRYGRGRCSARATRAFAQPRGALGPRRRALGLRCDVTSAETCARWSSGQVKLPIDILVEQRGPRWVAPVATMAWRIGACSRELTGAFLCSQAAGRHDRAGRGGSHNIASARAGGAMPEVLDSIAYTRARRLVNSRATSRQVGRTRST